MFKNFQRFKKLFQKNYSQKSEQNEAYSKPLQWMHWIQAIGFTGIVISGYNAAKIDPKKSSKEEVELKKDLMHLHKSFGLLMLGLLVPRLLSRTFSKIPKPISGSHPIEELAGKASHILLYSLIAWMPISGFAMSYYSGYGAPFFKWKIKGAPKEKADTKRYKDLSNFYYINHHRAGKLLEFLIPIHVGAVGYHLLKKQAILSRMNIFK